MPHPSRPPWPPLQAPPRMPLLGETALEREFSAVPSEEPELTPHSQQRWSPGITLLALRSLYGRAASCVCPSTVPRRPFSGSKDCPRLPQPCHKQEVTRQGGGVGGGRWGWESPGCFQREEEGEAGSPSHLSDPPEQSHECIPLQIKGARPSLGTSHPTQGSWTAGASPVRPRAQPLLMEPGRRAAVGVLAAGVKEEACYILEGCEHPWVLGDPPPGQPFSLSWHLG